MPLSDMQINEFVVLWKNAIGADISSEEAKQIAARLIHLYRVLVHWKPSNGAPNGCVFRSAETADALIPESS